MKEFKITKTTKISIIERIERIECSFYKTTKLFVNFYVIANTAHKKTDVRIIKSIRSKDIISIDEIKTMAL